MRVSQTFRWIVLTTGLIMTIGCSPSNDSSNATGESSSTRPPPPPAPLSEQDCLDFCDRVLKAVDSGNVNDCVDLVAIDIILDRMIKGLGFSEKQERTFRQGLTESTNRQGGAYGIVSLLVNQEGSTYDFIRLKMEDTPTAIFRLIYADGSLNYHQVQLVKCPDGKVRASDITPAGSGEAFSQTMRRAAIQLAAYENRSLIERLTGKEKAFIKNQEALLKISQAMKPGGNPRRGMQIYQSLPEELQQDKTYLIMYLTLATTTGSTEEYVAAFETLKKHYPSDPAISLNGIDYHIVREEFDEAIQCVEALVDFAGDDAYIHFLLGNIHRMAGDLDDAQREIRTAIELEDDLSQAHLLDIQIELTQNDFKTALSRMKEFDQKFSANWKDILTIPEFAEFNRSPQYQEWLEYVRSQRGFVP